MKPTKMKSSGELEEYIAELKEQLKQAKLDKREALAPTSNIRWAKPCSR